MEQKNQSSAQQDVEFQVIEKISRKDAIERNLKRYFTGNPCKYGHVKERIVSSRICVECSRLKAINQNESRKDYFHKYYTSEKYKEMNRKKSKCKEYKNRKSKRAKELYHEQLDLSRKRARNKYYNLSIEQRKLIRDRNKRRLKNDKNFRMMKTMRNILWKCLNLSGQRKTTRTEILIGYKKTDLVSHIENLFELGMSWNNYGTVWEIDHIYPVSYCIKNGITDPKIINQLGNLRPMLKTENRSKFDKVFETPDLKGITKPEGL